MSFMAITLFWRLILGYLAILLLSVGATLYSIVQLGELSQTARVAIEIDYRTIAYQENLTDAFLSQVRYGGKYLVTQSPASYDQFRQFKNDFLQYLTELKSAGADSEINAQLARVERLHNTYHELFEQEVRYNKAGQLYAQSRFQQERDKLLDNTLRELARVKDRLEKNVHDKLEHMGGSARAARRIAIATTLILLVFGTGLSLKISASVTKPLLALKNRTQDDASDPALNAQLSSIPEIQELSNVLTERIRRLQQSAESSGNQLEQFTEDLAARIISHKTQLNALKTASKEAPSQQSQSSMDKLIAETNDMIRYCAELNASAAAQREIIKLSPRTALAITEKKSLLDDNTLGGRYVPESFAVTLRAVRRVADRCAHMLAPLVRQLRLNKNFTDKPSI
jgi:CHASE3 domain sensor protein